MVGAGQLARMMVAPAVALGIDLRVLAARPDDSAAQVVPDVVVGSPDSLADVRRLARAADVVTFEHEHVPGSVLTALLADGVPLAPGPAALVHAQDKIVMRAALAAAGVGCPRWSEVGDVAEVERFAGLVGWPVVLKAPRGGYDGRGVWVVGSAAEAGRVLASDPERTRWLAEERVDFVMELAAQVARSPYGQAVAYPVVRTVQTDGICTEVVAPAPDLDDDLRVEAERVALQIAGALDVTGMLAVELFLTRDGRLLVNELAMRPHNSGHWTIDAAVTSQFENHLRAVLDLPLGSPRMTARHAVMVNVLGGACPTCTPRTCTAWRTTRGCGSTCTARRYGRGARWGT